MGALHCPVFSDQIHWLQFPKTRPYKIQMLHKENEALRINAFLKKSLP